MNTLEIQHSSVIGLEFSGQPVNHSLGKTLLSRIILNKIVYNGSIMSVVVLIYSFIILSIPGASFQRFYSSYYLFISI